MSKEFGTGKVHFGNWSTMERKDFNEVFETYYEDDGELIAFTKETFTHEEDYDDIQFDYKMGVKVTCMKMFIGENEEGYNNVHCELYMVPLPQYLSDKATKDIMSYCGISKEEISLYDIITSLQCPILERDMIEVTDEDDCYTPSEVHIIKEMLDACASICCASNSLRGFALDRVMNMIGTTGWDFLWELIQGKDAIRETINRYSA